MDSRKDKNFARMARICAVLIFGIQLFCLAETNSQVILQSNIQLNESLPPITLFQDLKEAEYTWFLNDRVIFPVRSLSLGFLVSNNANSALKLAQPNESFMKYLKLKYSYPQQGVKEVVNIRFLDTLETPLEKDLFPSYAQSNYMKPKQAIRGMALCSWSDLAALDTGSVQFQLVFDNTSAAKDDSSIMPVQLEGGEYSFIIRKIPSNRLDSIFALSYYADRLNARGQFQAALEECANILALDSTNLQAYRTAADVLWKMNNFAESIVYAERALHLLDVRTAELGIKENNTNVDYLYREFRTFIDKCQRREKWKWAK